MSTEKAVFSMSFFWHTLAHPRVVCAANYVDKKCSGSPPSTLIRYFTIREGTLYRHRSPYTSHMHKTHRARPRPRPRLRLRSRTKTLATNLHTRHAAIGCWRSPPPSPPAFRPIRWYFKNVLSNNPIKDLHP